MLDFRRKADGHFYADLARFGGHLDVNIRDVYGDQGPCSSWNSKRVPYFETEPVMPGVRYFADTARQRVGAGEEGIFIASHELIPGLT
jgi:hypothetical protein